MFKFVVTKNITELFHRAVLQNDLVRVKLLLEQAKDEARFNIDEINEDGLTALQFSCFASNLELVRLLVEHGANIKVQDRDGWTLSHAAALGGNVDIVRYLAKLGVHVGCKNDDEQLPIDLATDIPTVIILLKYMLENGHHGEVQAYLQAHPHLKYEISREINIAIKLEHAERQELESLPYTSHRSRRSSQRSSTSDTLSNNNNNNSGTIKRKVKGAFSMLPSPISQKAINTHDARVVIQPAAEETDATRQRKPQTHLSSGSSLAESDSSSASSSATNRKMHNMRNIERSASARSDEYYNYHLNMTRMTQRDDEVRRSVCMGNVSRRRMLSAAENTNCFYSDDENIRSSRRQAAGLTNDRHATVRRAASIQYPEVYI